MQSGSQLSPQDLGLTERSNGTTPATSPHPPRRVDPTSSCCAQASTASEHSFGGGRRAQRDGWWHHQWLGNLTASADDANGFYDRSLGTQTHGTPTAGPHRLLTASNRSTSSPRRGDLATAYDAAGNLTDLVVKREGTCLPTGASCWQRYRYQWDELSRLTKAQRWDLTGAERTSNATPTSPVPARTANIDLRHAYSASGDRVLKTSVTASATERHTVYLFPTLELRQSQFTGGDYELSATTAQVRLFAPGVAARVVYAQEDLPSLTSGQQHVLLELGDHLGSATTVLDKATGELVEYRTYQAYGEADADYRPARWAHLREPYGFTGKEADIEVGLVYFGARYYSPALMRWVSPDPVTVHAAAGDLNPYAYVNGRVVVSVDPRGELPILAVIGIAVVAGAVIGGSINAASQIAGGGAFNAGSFAAAMVTGGLAGGVGVIAGPGLGAAIAIGAGAGALGYGLDIWWGGGQASWGGLALSVGIGAAGGAAGYGLGKALGAGRGAGAGRGGGQGAGKASDQVGKAAGDAAEPGAPGWKLDPNASDDPAAVMLQDVPQSPKAAARPNPRGAAAAPSPKQVTLDIPEGQPPPAQHMMDVCAEGICPDGQLIMQSDSDRMLTVCANGGCRTPGGAGGARQAVGAAREARVAELTSGKISGARIEGPSLGSTDIDVLAGNGDLVMVGGPKKAADLGNLGRTIRLYQREAASRGVGVQAHFTADTPQSVLDFTAKRIGAANVFRIPE